MSYQQLFGKVYQMASDGMVAGTQFLVKRGVFRSPGDEQELLGEGDWQYRVDRHWSKADPALVPVNNCHEMVMDRSGLLYLITDHPKNNIIVYDKQGKVVDTWSFGSKAAHGLTISDEGDRQVLWVCDPFTGRVMKMSLTGELLMTLPGPHELGIYGAMQGYAPTQTAVAPNGDIYVADGYGSQHVIQFTAAGEYVRHFAGKGKDDSALDFAHGIAVDGRLGAGHEILLVTSRKQGCIKQFSMEGEYLGTIDLLGGYPCRPVIHGENVYIGLCWSGAHLNPNSGFVVVLDKDNHLCATIGGHFRYDDSGQVKRIGSDYSCFHHVHDVCVDDEDNIYVCEWNAGRVYPVKLTRCR